MNLNVKSSKMAAVLFAEKRFLSLIENELSTSCCISNQNTNRISIASFIYIVIFFCTHTRFASYSHVLLLDMQLEVLSERYTRPFLHTQSCKK